MKTFENELVKFNISLQSKLGYFLIIEYWRLKTEYLEQHESKYSKLKVAISDISNITLIEQNDGICNVLISLTNGEVLEYTTRVDIELANAVYDFINSCWNAYLKSVVIDLIAPSMN